MPQPTQDNPNVQTSDSRRGDGETVDSAATAENLASSLLEKQGSGPSGNVNTPQTSIDQVRGNPRSVEDMETPEPQPVETQEETEEPTEATEPAEEEVEEATQEAAAEAAASPESSFDESDYAELLEAGIDLGVKPSDVPADLMPAYNELVQSAIDQHSEAMEARLEAQEAQMQIADFAETLQENPQQVLTTMAVQSPDAFQEAMQTFERMQTDEEFRDMKIRELEADAKLKEAERLESARQEQRLEQKAERVRNRTRHVADRHGVDEEVAEQVVASAIIQNDGDIGLSEVDEIVAGLAPAGSQTTEQPKQPETRQKEEQANKPVADKGASPEQTTEEAEESTSSRARGGLRNVLSRAADRVDQQLGR